MRTFAVRGVGTDMTAIRRSSVDTIEAKLSTHDQAIAGILGAIRELMTPPEKKKRPIGLITPHET